MRRGVRTDLQRVENSSKSAPGTLHRAHPTDACQDAGMTTRTEEHQDESYDPAGEVVEICRDLIRMDTTNFGDGSGPGERKAAEHVAALLDEVGIESELFEGVAGRTNVVARWGGSAGTT